ncbi:OmpP1/FadL family transporter [Xylanibacter brevis]|uniref:OmpP1/FadL family transporter n=1 Tax=Xylanibacter brevis TaxID=83231 RepID=UPI0004831E38|nr:outer membrane beta-barrel protein [Xylanibacter brevis]
MKRFFLFVVAASMSLLAEAGGLMTNTNYHIAFDRMFARGATSEIDATYSNPAGLVWGREGLQLSLNFQKPWQNRDIEANVPALGLNKTYKGEASAPVVPALFAVYKQDRWAVSTMIGIVGSGGFVKYDEGVPMFTAPIMARLAAGGLQPGTYDLDAQMKGKQYIYGGQVNFSYKLTDYLSAAVGLRANYYDGYYRGHVVAQGGPVKYVNLQLDCSQKGWGFNPLVSVNYHQDKLSLAARYEFRTKINVPNDTKELSADVVGMSPQQVQAAFGDKIAAYQDGVKTRYDMPSLLVLAAQYEFTPKLRAAAEYHFYDDKNAKMSGNRQENLEHGTHEVLLGAEYDINDRFTVSLGGQRTDYGLADDYQTHTSFACDSYSLGCGAAVNLTKNVRLNVSYFCTLYSDYKKEQANYQGLPGVAGSDTFSRTNHVIGLGLDYKF